MKKYLGHNILQFFLRLILSLVFILSGIEKISNPAEFALSIENYKLLPIWAINIVAISLPWTEMFAGVLLLFNIWVKENTVIISMMLLTFTLMVLSAVIRNLDINCGCFGTMYSEQVGILKIIENLLLLLFGFLIFKFNKTNSDAIKINNEC